MDSESHYWRVFKIATRVAAIVGGIAIVLFAVQAAAQPQLDVCDKNTACLSWTHDGTDTDGNSVNVVAYRVFWGYSTGNYSQTQDLGGSTMSYEIVFSLSQPTEFFFAVKAISDKGQSSAYSNEVNKTFVETDFPVPSAAVLDVELGEFEFVPPPDSGGDPSAPIFDSDVVSNTFLIFEDRPALSRQSARYELDVTINILGLQMGLFSKDEVGMDDPGHTTLWVMPDGHLYLRHQNVPDVNLILESTALLQAGVTHKVIVDFDETNMTLILDGQVLGSLPSFGLHQNSLKTIVGGACHQCIADIDPPTPVLTPLINASVRLRVYP